MTQVNKYILLIVLALATLLPCILYAQNSSPESIPEVSEATNSGCVNTTRATTPQILELTKEGDIVTCELRGIVANCGLDYFDVNPEYKVGKDAPDSLFLDLSPVITSDMDCTCPYNVSFTIRNVKSDSLFLYCWLYTGMVSFKDSDKVTLEFSSERVAIDGSLYFLYKPGKQAMLYRMARTKGEVRIPSTINYEGQDYAVESFNSNCFSGQEEMTELFFPNSIRRLGESNDEMRNYFNGQSPLLEAIEVEAGCPLLSSVDGILYSGDSKTLYCLPTGRKLTEYTVASGVERIGICAFVDCSDLKAIRLPESVTTIRPYAFVNCKNLNAIYISGKINQDRNTLHYAFENMNSAPTLYVPESDVEFFKTIYKHGSVLPISGQTLRVANITSSASISETVYGLQGRSMKDKSYKGVYIQKGKKVVK